MQADKISFNGDIYRLSGNYYRRNVWGSKGASNLHRAIWQYHHGIIPVGYEIHHVDGDTFNNDIANLECVEMREHQRQHMLERIARGEMQPPSQYALEQAAKWHRSEEGLEWHKKHAKDAWIDRKWYQVNCQECNQAFNTPYPTRAKFCHQNCKAMALRRRRGAKVGVRPDHTKERLLYGKRIISQ